MGAWLLTTVLVTMAPVQGAQLDYQRGDGAERCVEEETLRQLVVDRVGHPVWKADASLTVHVVISADEKGTLNAHTAVIDEAGNKSGERDLHSTNPDCHELSAAVALDISVVLDPEAVLGLVEPPPPPPPPPRRFPRRAPRLLDDPPPPRPMFERHLHYFVDAGGALSWGQTVTPAPSLLVAGGFRFARFSVATEAHLMLPARKHLDNGATLSTALHDVGMVPCLHVGVMHACAVAKGAFVTATASGLEQARSITWPTALAGARLGVALPMGPHFELVLSSQGLAALRRLALRDSQSGALYFETAPVALDAAASVRATFP